MKLIEPVLYIQATIIVQAPPELAATMAMTVYIVEVVMIVVYLITQMEIVIAGMALGGIVMMTVGVEMLFAEAKHISLMV